MEGTASQPSVVCCQRASHADATLERSEPSLQDPKGALHVSLHSLQPLGPPFVGVGPTVFERRDHARPVEVAIVTREPDSAELAANSPSIVDATKQSKGAGWQHTTVPHACCKVVKLDKCLAVPSPRMTTGGMEATSSMAGSEAGHSGRH